MSEQNYQIVMHTPLGLRYGSMCCRITGGNMEGTISLMGHTQPFRGTIAADGSCRIEGEDRHPDATDFLLWQRQK